MARWRTHNNRSRPRWIYIEDNYVLHSRRHGILWKDPYSALESRIYDEQLKLIEEEYGKDADCNLGWGVQVHKDQIIVETKIYVEGRPLIVSTGYVRSGIIEHDWA